jgi:hypothetical protein
LKDELEGSICSSVGYGGDLLAYGLACNAELFGNSSGVQPCFETKPHDHLPSIHHLGKARFRHDHFGRDFGFLGYKAQYLVIYFITHFARIFSSLL